MSPGACIDVATFPVSRCGTMGGCSVYPYHYRGGGRQSAGRPLGRLPVLCLLFLLFAAYTFQLAGGKIRPSIRRISSSSASFASTCRARSMCFCCVFLFSVGA